MFMTGDDYRESLRSYRPRVFVQGRQIDSVVDEPLLRPGINALALTYDFAFSEEHKQLTIVQQHTSGNDVHRFLHINRHRNDLLEKLELVRRICRETGCAMRYLTMDGFNAVYQASHCLDADLGTDYHTRFLHYLHEAQRQDLTVGIAMTDAKGDRSRRPHQQQNPETYVRVVERRGDGILISGTKAIVTSAPYVHHLLVLPSRAMTERDQDYALACAVPIDAPGLTILARPAGRPGESGAVFSGRYGQSTALCYFDRVFVPWSRVFLCGEWRYSERLTRSYATHHRHTCIGARAGFGDLLIGAGALMVEANGLSLERQGNLRDAMVELITLVESCYACGVAASVFGVEDPAGNVEPEPVYANIGKLLLARCIYDMHRLAHTVSGGLVVTLPSPEEDHNPQSDVDVAALLTGGADIPYSKRASVARFMEDITASDAGGWMSVISLHGGGSPDAMKREIHRRYPVMERQALVERLIERGVHPGQSSQTSGAQPGQCCERGCVESDPQSDPHADPKDGDPDPI